MNVQTPPKLRHPEKAHKPDNAVSRKPRWIRQKKIVSNEYYETRRLMRDNELATVCEEAACPNVGECWSKRHATMMIMGETCTRGCSFCNVTTGKPDALDAFEPGRVARAVKQLGLRHVVITSVDRDDLADGGAEHIAQTIRAVRHQNPGTTVEVLTPDFLGKGDAGNAVFEAAPDVFNHNLETVPRLYPTVRHGARYYQSLRLLDDAKRANPSLFTKSGLMVGLGETMEEVVFPAFLLDLLAGGHRMDLDDLVHLLAARPSADRGHEDLFRGHERQFLAEIPFDLLRINNHSRRNVQVKL